MAERALDITDVRKDLHILIADDYALTRDMIRSILKQFGFLNLFVAEDGKKALAHLQAVNIELVICDWNMPLMSGIELLRVMRADPRLQNIPFLMLTGEAYRENVIEAAKSGVTDYISKPFTAHTLGEKIAAALLKASTPQ